MKIFRFDPSAGRAIERYGSAGAVLSRIAHPADEAVINCIYVDRDGLIGYHQATIPQLFLVVQGEGWVRGASSGRIPISAGQAAYWEKGEGHESGTQIGMTVIVIESRRIDPAEFMQPLYPG